jgi:hypothetical protein
MYPLELPKLTKRQKQVMIDICNGGELITSSEVNGAWIGFRKEDKRKDYRINNGVFFNLLNKGVIFQDGRRSHGYYPLPRFIECFKK